MAFTHRRRRLLGALFVLVGTLFAGDVAASSVAPIVITLLGPDPVRVRVAQGPGRPCDSSENRMLVDGKFGAGSVQHTATTDVCVCVQHTIDPFSDVDWSPAVSACRPALCAWRGRVRVCVPDPDPTIRIEIRSGSSD